MDPGTATFGSSPQEVDAGGATVRCRLLSIAGITPGKIRWSIEGTNNEDVAKPTLTSSGSPSGQIVSFVVPAGSNQAYLVQCEVNGGPDVNGDAATRARGKFCVLNAAGRHPICFDEKFEDKPINGTYSIIDQINDETGGSVATLSNVFYVDSGFGGSSTGSISAPFSTLTDAVAAVAALGANAGGAILVAPGDYTGESAISWAGTGSPPRKLSIAGLSVSQDGAATLLPTLDTSGTGVVSLKNVQATLDGSGPVFAVNCTLTGTDSNDVTMDGGTFQGTTGIGGLVCRDTTLGTIDDCAFLNARDGELDGTVDCSGGVVTFIGTRIAETTITFTGSPGQLNLDSVSNYDWVQTVGTLNNGSKTLIHSTA